MSSENAQTARRRQKDIVQPSAKVEVNSEQSLNITEESKPSEVNNVYCKIKATVLVDL